MLDEKYLRKLEDDANAAYPKPYQVPVAGEKQGLVLLGALETHLVTRGFEFDDVPGDKNNLSCIKSRKGFKSLMGKHGVHFCIRLFRRADGTCSFFLHVQ